MCQHLVLFCACLCFLFLCHRVENIQMKQWLGFQQEIACFLSLSLPPSLSRLYMVSLLLISLSLSLSLCLSVSACACLSLSMTVCLSVCLSVLQLSVCLSVCLSLSLSLSLCLCTAVYLLCPPSSASHVNISNNFCVTAQFEFFSLHVFLSVLLSICLPIFPFLTQTSIYMYMYIYIACLRG